jgi:acyl-CoA synthetase (AMP-forming)/AMP-acid ligase II
MFGWLDAPPPGRGLHVAGGHGEDWTFHSYERLAAMSRGAAGALRAAGVSPGEVVVIVCPTSAPFVAYFFGTLLVGATPSVVAVPAAFGKRDRYHKHLGRVIRLVGARVVATVPALVPDIEETVRAQRCELVTDLPPDPGEPVGCADPQELAIVQLSSGSTGQPRAVRVPMSAVVANIRGIGDWLRFQTASDGFASWLPLHHDMGLVGSLLFPMAHGVDLRLMQPEQFLRQPARWLECFAPGRATTTTTPTFGLTYTLRRVRPRDIETLDLTGFRTLIVGAERIDAATITGFVDLLSPQGFRAEAVLPAYGLAEATLAVTGRRHHEASTTIAADDRKLVLGGKVMPPADPTTATAIVGCGRPLTGVSVTVVGEDGLPVVDGVLGEIVVRGDSVAAGHLIEPGSGGAAYEPFHGAVATGDAGFQLDGELFIVGRLGDSVKQFGRWVFAEDIELVALASSPRPYRTTCLLGLLDGHNTAVVVVEGLDGADAHRLGHAVFRRADELRTLVVSAPSGWISRTTSGKPRRRAMWQRLVDGSAAVTIAWDSRR